MFSEFKNIYSTATCLFPDNLGDLSEEQGEGEGR